MLARARSLLLGSISSSEHGAETLTHGKVCPRARGPYYRTMRASRLDRIPWRDGLALLLLAGVLGGMECARQRLHQTLTAEFSKAAGIPLHIGAMETTPYPPSLICRGVRLGTVLSSPRIDLIFAPSAKQPLAALRLYQPRVAIHAAALTPPTPSGKRRPGTARASETAGRLERVGASIRIEVYDAALALRGAVGGKPLTLSSESIYLRDHHGHRRLVLGETAMRWGAWRYRSFGAAIDFETTRFWVPTRGAALGGTLEGPPRLSLAVHRLRLGRRGTTLQLDASLANVRGKSGRAAVQLAIGPNAHGVGLSSATVHASRIPAKTLLSFFDLPRLAISEGTLDGELGIARSGSNLRFETKLVTRGLRLSHPALALGPVHFETARLRAAGLLIEGSGRLTLSAAEFSHGQLKVRATGTLNPPQRTGELRVALAPLSCQDALDSIPHGLAPALRGSRIDGSLGLNAQFNIKSAADDSTLTFNLTPFDCRVRRDPPAADVNLLLKRPLRLVLASAPGRVGDKRGPLLDSEARSYLRLLQIPLHLRSAFVTAEDSRFFIHKGFDLRQIARALHTDLHQERFARGASTISQQVVKNIFLHHRRTLARKLQEAALTWRLEQRLSKGQILELYLNLVEMGPGLHGVEQAARSYFNRGAQGLNPLQSVHLAALTPNPRVYAKRIERNRGPDAAWRTKLRMLLRMMRRAGALTGAKERRYRDAELKLVLHGQKSAGSAGVPLATLAAPLPARTQKES